jgi:hypothetical protein
VADLSATFFFHQRTNAGGLQDMFRTFAWIVLATLLVGDCRMNPEQAGIVQQHKNKELASDISHQDDNFEVQKVAEGIYAVVRQIRSRSKWKQQLFEEKRSSRQGECEP